MSSSTGNISEAELIDSSISGDKHAFGKLYDFYYKQIYRYAFYRLSNREEAADMAANIFLRAWGHLPEFGKGNQRNFRAWLYRIAHNMIIDHYRKQRISSPLQEAVNVPQRKPGPEESFQKRERSKALANAINKLNPIAQQIIACRFIACMSHKETAEIAGLSEGNVRIIQYRALQQLQIMFTKERDEG
ncbi:MAG TPA: sigma-70 family RNA polymerase sigma factor [Anaerolineae bacterium]|nr:sigma-70 family RNA polymerase sigma factor [Anaerolineae bacterium]